MLCYVEGLENEVKLCERVLTKKRRPKKGMVETGLAAEDVCKTSVVLVLVHLVDYFKIESFVLGRIALPHTAFQ